MEKELNGVAPLNDDPPTASDTTMLIEHCSIGWVINVFDVTFEPMLPFKKKKLQDFESHKTVIFYDSLHYLLPFRLGGPIKTTKEEDDSPSHLLQ